MQVCTFLWFDGRAEEAAHHYTSVFPDSAVHDIRRAPDGTAVSVDFDLEGHRFLAYNGGPDFTFTGAISLYVDCDSQDEIDAVWAGLTEGGSEGPGGSLTDRFGITWQILPKALNELIDDAEPEAAQRILDAVHAMRRIDIQDLIDARES